MKISFTIVNYNRKNELLITISKTKELMERSIFPFEIVVVDNASSDDSIIAIRAAHPDVILLENKINSGAPAWNLAFEQARGDYFIILDDDSHIDSGFDEAIQYLDANPVVGVLALNITGGAYETSKWKNMEEKAGFIGCGAILRRELYQKIGGYADWIFLYTNEWDYGIRCMEAGYKVIYFENCHVTHRTSSINRTTKRLIVFSVRNEMAIVYKFFSKNTRNKYIRRVFLNNLKGIIKYGPSSAAWYYEAMKEFKRLKKTLPHTPVRAEVEEFYKEKFWSTSPFLGIF